MSALVVYCHPKPDSFSAAVCGVVMDKLQDAGCPSELVDLYAEGFDPVLKPACLDNYLDESCNSKDVAAHVAALARCDTLIFVYPTWWYGLPAILKGWLDRVLLPGVAFSMPKHDGDVIGPGLKHIKRLAVFTTGGASQRLTWYIGSPGKRTLLRGVRILCAPRCRTVFAMHYLMDSSTDASRKAHLEKVARKMNKLMRDQPRMKEITT